MDGPDSPASLDDAARAARAVWPGIDVPIAELVGFLRERTGATPPSAERCAELYLTCACARGDPRAAAAFEERYVPELRKLVERRTRSRALTDDVLQMLRERLFVARAGAPAEIADFNGAGALAGWLRIVVVRMTQRLVRREERALGPVEAFHANLEARDDAELRLVRGKYGSALPEALRASWEACDAATRNLLRYRYLDQLSIDAVAAIRGVHRATAARWLLQAEAALVDGALRELAARFGTGPEEMRSVLRLIRSGLEISASRLFKS